MDKKKILIIEDERFVIKALKIEMQEEYDFIEALDGEKGEQLVRLEHPDLVILDLVLPKKSGFEVLEAIKKDSSTKDIPVLILTCLGEEKEKKKGLSLGAIDYLVKTDYRLGDISGIIGKILNKT